MEHVVKIHNAVNEKAWAHVMAWERRHCDSCPDPKLLKFRASKGLQSKGAISKLFGIQVTLRSSRLGGRSVWNGGAIRD